jgi:hypothetical protein
MLSNGRRHFLQVSNKLAHLFCSVELWGISAAAVWRERLAMMIFDAFMTITGSLATISSPHINCSPKDSWDETE